MHSALSGLSVVAILVTTLAIQSCSVNPVTGKTELSLMSQQQEIALGSKNYAPSRQSQGVIIILIQACKPMLPT